jgi:hypothetical protein
VRRRGRRCVGARACGPWECGHEIYDIPEAQGAVLPEGDGGLPAREVGQGQAASGGVFDHGTQEEDDPGTWEAHVSPRNENGATESRKAISDAQLVRGTHERPAERQRRRSAMTATSASVGAGNG